MAAELLLVNPRRRRRGKRKASTSRRKRRRKVIAVARNPRKRRHRRRAMSALQAKYFGGGARKRRRGTKRRKITSLLSNPRKRRHRRRRSGFLSVRRNPSPISNPVGYFQEAAIPAIAGAFGGMAVNYIFSNYAPASMQGPLTGPISRLALAAILGVAVGAASNKRYGSLVAGGAMVITVYDIAEQYMQGMAGTSAQGGGMNRYVRMGRYTRMGRMKGPRRRRMGYFSPARTGGMGRYVGMGGGFHPNLPSSIARLQA